MHYFCIKNFLGRGHPKPYPLWRGVHPFPDLPLDLSGPSSAPMAPRPYVSTPSASSTPYWKILDQPLQEKCFSGEGSQLPSPNITPSRGEHPFSRPHPHPPRRHGASTLHFDAFGVSPPPIGKFVLRFSDGLQNWYRPNHSTNIQ